MALAVLKGRKALESGSVPGSKGNCSISGIQRGHCSKAEPTSVEEGWSQERKPQSRPGEVM